jgi:UDP-N-acetylmuramate-alanine ligase
MCTDHPVVQSLVGRIEDHRMVTYGENPQADVRLVDISHAGGTSLFTIVFRDRAGQLSARDQECRAADAGAAQRAQRHGGDRGRA